MANNSKLYEKIWAIINGPQENASAEWTVLAESNNQDDNETCFLLAVQLRKQGRKREAFEASKELSIHNPSVKSYNIYLASAFDLTSKNELSDNQLKEIFSMALTIYLENGYEVNLAATLLKCCNYLISKGLADDRDFERVYSIIPDEDKIKNTFIISQYYRRLISDGLTEKLLKHYTQLLPEYKENRAIVNIVNKIQRSQEIETNITRRTKTEMTKKITIISDQETAQKYSAMVENFSLAATTVDICSDNIIEDLNKAIHKSTTAIIIVTQETVNQSQFCDIFPFILGFCAHKFGRSEVKIFQHESVAGLKHDSMKEFEISCFNSDIEFLTLLGRLKLIGA